MSHRGAQGTALSWLGTLRSCLEVRLRIPGRSSYLLSMLPKLIQILMES